ncbi:MAG: U32 family peptidase [Verrucomicrobia bacterium]|nr:U32 family peptidase [Verrucomicrobiota bacterium]MBU4290742.1 U32 family peptidase [Verrucomicrobiota bacterium]MBU4428675.1 U32 family peptidase [Verrucomicrobiota bacterium]MCG2679760.1 U32 family peptidase [Kiritimatiellia bacterium]
MKTNNTYELPVELLAPAGGPESGYAALHYGADAIYLGLAKFSARADAENFTLDQVSEMTGYAHSLTPRRRVYVTVNTLVLQHELDDLVDCLGALSEIGVDALIIQDLGVGYIARRHFPELRLHASTQMAIHNRQGVEAARDLGFARVTLARELTLEEIAAASAVPGVETEMFVHGALCYAYSGLCLFSSQTLGRSGNRGRCAYLCRDQFTISGANPDLPGAMPVKAGFFFSMKDLALADALPALRRTGVAALKIEGRKKSPLYVAATVNFYRKLLDGALSDREARALAADIQTVFSRSWTSLFIPSRDNRQVIDRERVGHRGTPIGKVDAVVRSRSGEGRLRFRTSREIEMHDGLQIDVPGLQRPYGFAVDWFRIASLPKSVRPTGPAGAVGDASDFRYRAPAGSVLEVALPADHPLIPRGVVIYCASSQAIKRRYRFARPKPGLFRVRPQVEFRIELSPTRLMVTASMPRRMPPAVEATLSVTGDFQATGDPGRMDKTFQEVFAKLGATPFAAGPLTVHNPEARFVPMSQLNPLRRRLLDALEQQLKAAVRERLEPVKQAFAVSGAKVISQGTGHEPVKAVHWPSAFCWSLKTDRLDLGDGFEPGDWSEVDEFILEIGADPPGHLSEDLIRLSGKIDRERIRLALPIIIRSWEGGALREIIGALVHAGWTKWQIANVSGWAWLRDLPALKGCGLSISADWPVYVTNRAAALQILAQGADSLTLSPEDGLENMQYLLAELRERVVVVAYQDTPLFISEFCVGAGVKGGCNGQKDLCVENLDLRSSFGDRVLAINRRCRTVVVNNRPFCLASRFRELTRAGAIRLRADFLFRHYTPERVRDIWRCLRAGKTIPGTQLANIDRGLE